jgi:hypothetical protein
MGVPRKGRLGLFVLASAALVAVALCLSGEERARPNTEKARTIEGRSPGVEHIGQERQLRADAARYFAVFLRYEQGVTGPFVVRRLRATVTRAFADELLGALPRVDGPLPRARLVAVRVENASWRPPIAIVSAEARRGGQPEELEFLFARERGRWRAAGPAP